LAIAAAKTFRSSFSARDVYFVVADERLLDERERAFRRGDHVRCVERGAGVGQRADHERVPAREDLLVTERLRTLLARVEHLLLRARGQRGAAFGFVEHRLEGGTSVIFEVAGLGDAVVQGDSFRIVGGEERLDVLAIPDEELSLFALAVGVLRCVERA
jgi:hypothetical protein